jgi:hypothetical protein
MGLFAEISQNIKKRVTFLTWAGINFGIGVGVGRRITTITAAAMKKKKDQCHDFRQLNSRAQCRVFCILFPFKKNEAYDFLLLISTYFLL